jgi:hypothetical protein
MWRHDEATPRIPTPKELETAETAIEYGRLYGYSEDDIAHFYNFRRRGHALAYDEYVDDLKNAAVPPCLP